MSEEEKKAIESFKKENNNDLSRFDDFNSYTQFKVKRDKIIINLIDNQQKEIEELKQNRDEYKEEYIKLLNARYYNYISKNKIREKIKELETAINQNKIMSIQVRQHGFAQKTIEQYVIRATVEILKELIEEDDGDHIPRID